MKLKLKLKLDGDAIKGFFAAHAEKIGVGIAVLVMLVFVAGAFKRETLPQDLQADTISTKSKDADLAIRNAVMPPKQMPPPVAVDGKIVPVAPDAYDFPRLIYDNPLLDPAKNADPQLFPVIEVQAHGFRGPLAVIGSPEGMNPMAGRALAPIPVPDPKDKKKAGEKTPKGALPEKPSPLSPFGAGMAGQAGPRPLPPNWQLPGAASTGVAEARVGNMITAAIPEEQMQKQYDAAFEHSMKADELPGGGPNVGGGPTQHRAADNTKPQYIAWRLERTELDADGKPVETRVIDTGDVVQVKNDIQDIQSTSSVKDYGKTVVLGSLKPSNSFIKRQEDIKTWSGRGEEVVSPECLGPAWLSWPLPPMLLHDWGREAANPKVPLNAPEAVDETPAGPVPAVPGVKKTDDDPFGGKAADAGSRERDPSAPSNPQARRPHFVLPGGQEMPGMRGQMQTVPYRLFRYVDFDVQPGHAYQYRVQLVLRNPNYGKDPHILYNADSGKQPYRDTPWSEKSPVASPPVDTRVIADSVVKPRNADIKGKVLVLEWFGDEKDRGTDKPYAIELLKDFELDFGAIANGGREVKDVADGVTRMIRDFKEKDTVFAANTALLDVHGGLNVKGLSDNSVEPAEMLLVQLDEKGHPTALVVTNQARDKQLADDWTATHVVPAWAMQNQGMAGGNPLLPSNPANSLLTQPKTGAKGGGPPRIGKGTR